MKNESKLQDKQKDQTSVKVNSSLAKENKEKDTVNFSSDSHIDIQKSKGQKIKDSIIEYLHWLNSIFFKYEFYKKMVAIIKSSRKNILVIGIIFYIFSFSLLFIFGVINNLEWTIIVYRCMVIPVIFFLLGASTYISLRMFIPELFDEVKEEYYEFDLLLNDKFYNNFMNEDLHQNLNRYNSSPNNEERSVKEHSIENDNNDVSSLIDGDMMGDIEKKNDGSGNKEYDAKALAEAVRVFLKKS